MTDSKSVLPKIHPVVAKQAAEAAANFQIRLADWITAFAGSMPFVYIHIAVFVIWMLWVEANPWPTLTLAVSLEAIFLSTFVMIGQNRQAAFQQEKADHEFVTEELELKSNTQRTEDIHRILLEVQKRLAARDERGHDAEPDESGQTR